MNVPPNKAISIPICERKESFANLVPISSCHLSLIFNTDRLGFFRLKSHKNDSALHSTFHGGLLFVSKSLRFIKHTSLHFQKLENIEMENRA